MPRIVVRKGYRCLPGKRRELLAALQRVDAAATAAGWPRGRYLFVETKSPGEPDLEVEFTFDSYAELEQLERRLREHLGRVARDVGSAGQELLLEPSATRHLLLLDEPLARPVTEPSRQAVSPGNGTAGAGGAEGAGAREPDALPSARTNVPTMPEGPPPLTPPSVTAPKGTIGAAMGNAPAEPAPIPGSVPPGAENTGLRPPLTVAQERARQLSAARAAMESAERTVGLPPEKRASQRQQPLSKAHRVSEDRALADPDDDDSLDATA
ncbi:MAG: hypothetical protein M3442_02480 [Chloroflexota bacterium]|nr:hypothetical protein [Chloroflexota bacterium]